MLLHLKNSFAMPCFKTWYCSRPFLTTLPEALTCHGAETKESCTGLVCSFLSSFRFISISEGDVPAGTGATAMRSPRTTAAAGACQTSMDMAPSFVVGKAQSSTAGDLHLASPSQRRPPTALLGATHVVGMDLL